MAAAVFPMGPHTPLAFLADALRGNGVGEDGRGSGAAGATRSWQRPPPRWRPRHGLAEHKAAVASFIDSIRGGAWRRLRHRALHYCRLVSAVATNRSSQTFSHLRYFWRWRRTVAPRVRMIALKRRGHKLPRFASFFSPPSSRRSPQPPLIPGGGLLARPLLLPVHVTTRNEAVVAAHRSATVSEVQDTSLEGAHWVRRSWQRWQRGGRSGAASCEPAAAWRASPKYVSELHHSCLAAALGHARKLPSKRRRSTSVAGREQTEENLPQGCGGGGSFKPGSPTPPPLIGIGLPAWRARLRYWYGSIEHAHRKMSANQASWPRRAPPRPAGALSALSLPSPARLDRAGAGLRQGSARDRRCRRRLFHVVAVSIFSSSPSAPLPPARPGPPRHAPGRVLPAIT